MIGSGTSDAGGGERRVWQHALFFTWLMITTVGPLSNRVTSGEGVLLPLVLIMVLAAWYAVWMIRGAPTGWATVVHLAGAGAVWASLLLVDGSFLLLGLMVFAPHCLENRRFGLAVVGIGVGAWAWQRWTATGMLAWQEIVITLLIAPQSNGVLVEKPATGPGPTEAATPYHHAKARAEQDVVACGLPWRILRPPFVVGHSGTHAATHFAGLYAMARRLRNTRTNGAVLDIPDDAELNLMPVDVLARAAVAVGTTGPTGTVYHLTNASAPSSRTVLDSLFTWCGLPIPHYRTGGAHQIPAALAPYLPYFHAGTIDHANTERAAGQNSLRAPLGADDLHRLLDAYLATLLAD